MRYLLLLGLALFGAGQAQAQMNHAAMPDMSQQAMPDMSQLAMAESSPQAVAGMSNNTMPGMVHDYAPIQVPDNVPLPQLALSFHRDAMSGVNLHLELRNFALGPPERQEQPGLLNGHAHLYINGKKIQRVYGPDLHLPAELFQPGINLVLVSLNAHSHAVWQTGNKQLMASSFIDLGKEPLVLHSFSSVPLR